jgi:hypothetical protein
MCNLAYDYSKDDDVVTALRKAIYAIRHQGVKVYNFQVNIEGASAEINLDFLTYAMEQQMRTSTNRVFTLGAPSFTGFADFAQHLRTSLDEKPRIRLVGEGVPLRMVVGTKVETITPAENTGHVSEELARIQTGYWDPRIFRTFRRIQDVALANLHDVDPLELKKFCLVVVSFRDANLALEEKPEEDPEEEARQQKEMVDDMNLLLRLDLAAPPGGHQPVTSVPTFKLSPTVEFLKYAWAVCPKASVDRSLFVAREGINGTLALARTVKGTTSVVAYLTGVDQMSGAYLLPTSSDGEILLTLRAPQRTDVQIAAKGSIYANRDRQCVGLLKLEDRELIAY